ncbi:ribonuclease III [Propionispira raffinosivorans]|uniref:ribonuclease III n=1 Tax=Propionispira raffinosivorans TaxID=86959 RepID=UPI00037A2BAF|nr:ribonuclease III [Propionispira raffinosivorans]
MNVAKKLTEERKAALVTFAKKLGVAFTDWNLLHQALTHTSYANEAKRSHIVHNERLEFLGDAVLELATSSYLFKHFPNLPEGELTKARASVVCEATLAKRASKLNVGEYLLFGKGELATGGKTRASILADAFEAVIGAIYMDQGMQKASSYILKQLQDDLLMIETGKNIQDYKTLLQEVIQKNIDQKIHYALLSEDGPDHNKIFEIAVMVNDEKYGIGFGKSKKEAEQHAAKAALAKMNKIDE